MDEKNRMRMARERAEFINEQAAADRIGCSRPLVIAWEKDEADPANSSYAYQAAVAYKVRPEWIFDPRQPDGFPWEPSAPTNATPTPEKAAPLQPTIVPGQLNEIHLVMTALARVLAATKLDTASMLRDELLAIPEGPLQTSILGIVRRERAKLKHQSPTSPDRKAPGSKKHSRA